MNTAHHDLLFTSLSRAAADRRTACSAVALALAAPGAWAQQPPTAPAAQPAAPSARWC